MKNLQQPDQWRLSIAATRSAFPQLETMTAARARSRKRSRRALDRGERAQASCDAPRLHVFGNTPHASVTIDEEDVERELHEERVHGVARGNHQRFVVETRSAEESLAPRGGVDRRGKATDDLRAGIGIEQRPLPFGVTQDRLEE